VKEGRDEGEEGRERKTLRVRDKKLLCGEKESAPLLAGPDE
jgi:hypothetical protein